MAEIIFERTGSVEAFITRLSQLSTENTSILILACDANGFEKALLDPALQACDSTIIGAVFPSIIYNADKYDKGTLLIGLDEKLQVNIMTDISQKDQDRLDTEMQAHSGRFDASIKSMLVFVDGLTKNIGACVDVLFDNYGLELNYIGGGSGSLSFEQRPSLFTNEGLLEDAFIYAYSTRPSSIGVDHGWKSIRGPFQVTRAEGTVIKELDFRPAFSVYKKVVDQYSLEPIDKDNFFSIAKSFPFGINTVSDARIVRDPILLNGDEMVCVGSVEEGDYVDILQGNSDDLIQAARDAALSAQKGMHFEEEFTLFIDCISRVLFLDEKFEEEIMAVYREGPVLVGALTFGEIANDGRAYLQFFNKTAVVGRIGHA